jgi:hypothetical protein
MNNHKNKRPLHAVTTTLLGLGLSLAMAGGAQATQVQSALPDYMTGMNVADLLWFYSDTAVPASTHRPAAMGTATAGAHLGTNTDIFAVGSDFERPTEFWIRYTLDATSQEYHRYINWEDMFGPSYESTSSVNGELWVSFNTETQALAMHTEKLEAGNLLEYSDTVNISLFPEQGTIDTLRSGSNGEPEYGYLPGTNATMLYGACIECKFQWTLNLAFLQLSWNGSGYDLLTSAQGFDQIYAFSSEFAPNDDVDRYRANIAPVPVPGALWLFGSSVAGLAAMRRRRIAATFTAAFAGTARSRSRATGCSR